MNNRDLQPNDFRQPDLHKANVGCCPVRVQRKRVKGWRMPVNTVSVTRPGRWGNPFKIGDYIKVGNGVNGWQWIRALNEKYADDSYTHIETVEQCIELYRKYITNYPPKDLHDLKGKNLACFCPLDKPCHADVLLEAANG